MTAEEKLKKIEKYIDQTIEDIERRKNYNLSLYAGQLHALSTVKGLFFDKEEE